MSISRRDYEHFESKNSEKTEKTDREPANDSEKLKRLDPDKFVEAYGTYGRYQIITYVLVQTLNFFYSSSMYVMSFVQLNLNKTCVHDNRTFAMSQTCRLQTQDVRNYEYLDGEVCGQLNSTQLVIQEHTAKTNLLIDFGIHCTHWFFQELGLTIFTVGALVAVPIMSLLADRFGRKPIIVGSAIVAFLANLAAPFSPSYAVFLVFRTVIGAASDTYLSVASVATCEYISEKARAWITVVYNVAWSLGMVWTLMVTFMTDDWRWRYFIVVAPGVYAFFLWAFLPESPHWLILKNKTGKLREYMDRASRINKKTPDLHECQTDGVRNERHESIKAVCCSGRLVWILFANGFIEMVISLVYFSISFLSAEVGDDHVRAFLYSSLVEIPAGLAVLPLMMRLGRRTIVIWCLGLQTLSLMGVAAFLNIFWLKLTTMLMAKVMATIIYSVHPIWATEQFPTSVRSLCFSLMNVPQSLGIIMSPYLKHLQLTPDWMPFLVVMLLSFIATAFSIVLKETKNQKLPADVAALSNADDSAETCVVVVSSRELSEISPSGSEVGQQENTTDSVSKRE